MSRLTRAFAVLIVVVAIAYMVELSTRLTQVGKGANPAAWVQAQIGGVQALRERWHACAAGGQARSAIADCQSNRTAADPIGGVCC